MVSTHTYPVKGLLFDLDGTLVDSAADIALAANLTLETLGLEKVDTATLTTWIGNGAGTLMKRAITGEVDGEPDAGVFAKAMPAFFDHYADNVYVNSQLYPDVINTLDVFRERGIMMACVTNKPSRHTHALLAQANMTHFFSAIVASDSTPEVKPHPLPLLEACRQMSLEPEECLMIGDSINDIDAGRRANMPIIGLTYGYNQGYDLTKSSVDLLIDNFSSLIDLICKRRDP